jgi:hypothetical protein
MSLSGIVRAAAQRQICWKRLHLAGDCCLGQDSLVDAAVAALLDHIDSRPWWERRRASAAAGCREFKIAERRVSSDVDGCAVVSPPGEGLSGSTPAASIFLSNDKGSAEPSRAITVVPWVAKRFVIGWSKGLVSGPLVVVDLLARV